MTMISKKTKRTKKTKFDSYLFMFFWSMYDLSVICLPRQEITEILDESKQNQLLADYVRIVSVLSFAIFLLFILGLHYLRNELVKSEKFNKELILLFNKIQEDKLAVDKTETESESGPEDKIHPSENNSDSDESI